MRHRLSSGVCDRCRSIIADLMSAGNCACGIETAHIPLNQEAPGKITIFHVTLAAKSIFWLQFSLYQNKTISTFSSVEKTVAAFDLNFCQLKSTNAVNKVP